MGFNQYSQYNQYSYSTPELSFTMPGVSGAAYGAASNVANTVSYNVIPQYYEEEVVDNSYRETQILDAYYPAVFALSVAVNGTASGDSLNLDFTNTAFSLSSDGETILLNGTAFATVSGLYTGSLSVIFQSTTDYADVAALAATVTYTDTNAADSGVSTSRNIYFTFQDSVAPQIQTDTVAVNIGTAPAVPDITSISPETLIGGAEYATVNNLTLTGTGQAGDTINVSDIQGGVEKKLGTVTAGADGTWTLATGALADGQHIFGVSDTNAELISSATLNSMPVTIAAPGYDLSEISDPAATSYTIPTGINNSGDIVGYYDGPLGPEGFIDDQGSFTSLEYPSAYYIEPLAINDSGEVIGYAGYYNDGAKEQLGFVYSDGTYTALSDPAAIANSETSPEAINASGEITGNYYNGAETVGFIYSSGSYTTIADPSAASGESTEPFAINDSGEVTGILYSNTGEEGFIWNNGTYTIFDAPAGTTYFQPTAINASGEVIGLFESTSGQGGFIYNNGTYTVLSGPAGAANVIPRGINASGEVTGYYQIPNDNYDEDGFVYNNGTYTSLVYPGADYNYLIGIDDSREITGYFQTGNGGTNGFIAQLSAPPPPLITSASPATLIDGNEVSNATALTLSGTGQAEDLITVSDISNGATISLGSVTAASDGSWTLTTGTLAAGVQDFVATDTNADPLTSADSPDFAVTIQAQAELTTETSTGIVLGAGTEYTSPFTITATGIVSVDGGHGVYSSLTGVVLVNGGVVTYTGVSRDVGGVYFHAGGTVVNLQGAEITAFNTGVDIRHDTGTILNSGVILGGADGAGVGVIMNGGGYVLNSTKLAVIAGIEGIALVAGGTVVNDGTITATGARAVELFSGGTIVNAGVIDGSQYSVYFRNISGELVVEPGAVFIGNVLDGTGAGALELGSAASAGTLSGLGNSFSGFSQIEIDTGATWLLEGANALAAGSTLANAGELTLSSATLTGLASLVNNANIILDPSFMEVQNLSGTGVVTLEAGSTLDVTGDISAGETIIFAGSGAELQITSTADIAGTLSGAGAIDLIDLPYANFLSASFNASSDLLGITFTGANSPLELNGDFAGDSLAHQSDGANGTELTESALCYLHGTRILTPTGPVAVEDFCSGDAVVTRFGGIRRIKWLGRQNYAARFIAHHPEKFPVCIQAAALADGVPARNLYVSPGHSMLLGDVLVLAQNLVNGVTVTQTQPQAEQNYVQLDLGTHDCVLAEGAWSETYADAPGQRTQFHNAAEYGALYPDEPPVEALALCAPRLGRGAALEAALRPVVARAAAGISPGMLEGWVDTADDWNIAGWARDIAHPELPVLLEILAGEQVIGTALACEFRGDLHHAAKGRGNCAFHFASPFRLRKDALALLTIRRAADGGALAWAERVPAEPGTEVVA